MDYSIIIPTAFDKASLLKTCVESIKKYTDLSKTEIIVVANGVTDDTADWAIANGCCVVAFEEAIGYPKAINAGIEHSRGEFIVTFNNDVEILGPGWLDLMRAPFAADPTVAVSGPMKEHCAHAGYDFILFFCAMIKRSVIDELGTLDEIFSPGYSEDVDFCCRAWIAGYRVVQVPDDASHEYYDHNKRTSNFPIFHDGNQTFKDHPDADLITRNAQIIAQRYGKKQLVSNPLLIEKAKQIDGATSEAELTWLAQAATKSNIIIECGSLFGRSTRVLADNMPADGVLYAIDTWRGSSAEQGMIDHAALLDGDQDFNIFTRNLWDHIAAGRVVPLRMNGRNAAKLLHDKGVKADLVFLDAGHMAPEVKEDIQNFSPLLASDGILSGHDYFTHNEPPWIQVRRVVDELFPSINVEHEGTIWAVHFSTTFHPDVLKIEVLTPSRDSNIFDCFVFNNELDILERRLWTMWDTADRFIIVEGDKTHAGQPKELVFHNNLNRFEPYLSKITYIVVQDWPPVDPGTLDWSWVYERHQRDAIKRALTACQDNDVIVISDCDEIPNPLVVQQFQAKQNASYDESIAALEMDLFVYDDKTKAVDPWREGRVVNWRWLKSRTPCEARYTQCPAIPNGGIHLSWQGGVDAIIKKIENTAHQELNMPEFKDRAHIEHCLREGLDLFKRPNIKFSKV